MISLNKLLKKLLVFILMYPLLLIAPAFGKEVLPRLFLFLGGDEASTHTPQLTQACVSGAQIIYSWKQLEPKKGVYDFSKIEKDLRSLNGLHKKLFVQLQDRSFTPTTYSVPDYIREEPVYHGGVAMQYDRPGDGKPVGTGWVARVWDPAVRERYQLLIRELAAQFDGRIEGINLPETAVDFDPYHRPEGYTPDQYVNAELNNISRLRQAFKQSLVIQYVNFFPDEWNNDHGYMSRFFSYALTHQIGLGGPDVVPYRLAHMKNSYPFFHESKGLLLTGMAVQEPDYTYKNPDTGDYYRFSDFYYFMRDYLGARLIFWNVEEPFFSSQLVPHLNPGYFECHN